MTGKPAIKWPTLCLARFHGKRHVSKADTFAQLRSDTKLRNTKLVSAISMLAAGYFLVAIIIGLNPFERTETLNLWVSEFCEEPRRIDIIADLDANTVRVDFIKPATEAAVALVDARCARVHVGSDRRFEIDHSSLSNLDWGGSSHFTKNPVVENAVGSERQFLPRERFTLDVDLTARELAFDRFSAVLAFDALAQSRGLGEEIFNVRVWYLDRRPISNAIQVHIQRGSIDRRLINAIPSPSGTGDRITFPEQQSVDARALQTGFVTLEHRLPSVVVSTSFEHHQLKAIGEILVIVLSVVMGGALSALLEIRLARANRIDIATKDQQHVLLLPRPEEFRDSQDLSGH